MIESFSVGKVQKKMVGAWRDQKELKKYPYQTETVIQVTAQSIHSRSMEMNIEIDMNQCR